MGASDTVQQTGKLACPPPSGTSKAKPLLPPGTASALLLLVVLGTATATEVPATTPTPKPVVVLKDGTRYTLSKPYETRGAQARLLLANGTLVSIRASEIDVERTKRATLGQDVLTLPAKPKTLPEAKVGSAPATADRKPPLGARVKLDKEKAGTIFLQDVVPTPPSVQQPEAAPDASQDAALAEMMKADLEAEQSWRAREADRLSRLDAAVQAQTEICARYAAAVNSAGTQDGWISDAAGAILGALKADCDTASRKVDEVRAERAQLEEECRKTQGCKPGWLR